MFAMVCLLLQISWGNIKLQRPKESEDIDALEGVGKVIKVRANF